MNNPALKREVSIIKMLKLTNPWLRRSNVVLNSFSSCVSDAPKEFSRTPEMPFSKMSSEPGMFLHQHPRRITLKQLKSHAHRHSRRHLNKQVDVVNSNMQLINFASLSVSNLPQKKLTIHFQPIKLEWVSCIFNFPHEVECILPEAMLPGFQFHFLSPKSATRKRAHANLKVYFEEPSIQALPNSQTKELNLMENGDSSQNLKVWVSSPWM